MATTYSYTTEGGTSGTLTLSDTDALQALIDAEVQANCDDDVYAAAQRRAVCALVFAETDGIVIPESVQQVYEPLPFFVNGTPYTSRKVNGETEYTAFALFACGHSSPLTAESLEQLALDIGYAHDGDTICPACQGLSSPLAEQVLMPVPSPIATPTEQLPVLPAAPTLSQWVIAHREANQCAILELAQALRDAPTTYTAALQLTALLDEVAAAEHETRPTTPQEAVDRILRDNGFRPYRPYDPTEPHTGEGYHLEHMEGNDTATEYGLFLSYRNIHSTVGPCSTQAARMRKILEAHGVTVLHRDNAILIMRVPKGFKMGKGAWA